MLVTKEAEAAFARLVDLGADMGAIEQYGHQFSPAAGLTIHAVEPPIVAQPQIGSPNVNVRYDGHHIFVGRGVLYPLIIRLPNRRGAVFFGPGCDLSRGLLQLSASDATLSIGAETIMKTAAGILIYGEGGAVILGDRCVVCEEVRISNSDAHGLFDLATGKRFNFDRDVKIGNDVFLGPSARIGKGVTIGSGACVEERANVSRNVPERTKVVGNPARPVASDVTWDRAALSKPPPRSVQALPARSALTRPQHARVAMADAVIEALADLAQGRVFEPAAAYRDVSHESGVSLLVSEQAVFQPKAMEDGGHANAILLGLDANSKLLSVRFDGSDNIVFFGSHSRTNSLTVDIRGNRNRVYIGAETSIVSGLVTIEGDDKTVAIGDRCMLSGKIELGQAGEGRPGDVLIGDDVWLGREVVIHDGTTIGSGAMVGQCAVASGRLDGACIYSGNPAQKRREGIAWSRYIADTIEEARAVPEMQRQAKEAVLETIAKAKAAREQRARAKAELHARRQAEREEAERVRAAKAIEAQALRDAAEQRRAASEVRREAASRVRARRATERPAPRAAGEGAEGLSQKRGWVAGAVRLLSFHALFAAGSPKR